MGYSTSRFPSFSRTWSIFFRDFGSLHQSRCGVIFPHCRGSDGPVFPNVAASMISVCCGSRNSHWRIQVFLHLVIVLASSRSKCRCSLICCGICRGPIPTSTISSSCQKSLMRKSRHFTFLHSVGGSPSLLRNTQIPPVPRFVTLSRVSTSAIELRPRRNKTPLGSSSSAASAHFADCVSPTMDQTTLVHDGLNVFSPSCRGTSALAGTSGSCSPWPSGRDHGMGTHIFPGRGPCRQVPLPEAPYKVDGFLAAVFERHTCIHSLTVPSNSSRTIVLWYGLISWSSSTGPSCLT